MKKIKKFDIIYILIYGAFLVCSLFIPKTGRLALLDVAMDTINLLGVVVYLLLKIRKSKGVSGNKIYTYVVFLFLGLLCIWSVKNFAIDLVSEPKVVELHNLELSSSRATKVYILSHYYVKGIDPDGDSHRIEISKSDCTYISAVESVTIKYYENTNRLYEIEYNK